MKKTLGVLVGLLGLSLSTTVMAAWNADWATQQKISIETAAIKEAVNQAPVLVRLHSGNFDFTGASVDGADLRFIAADDKTELKFSLVTLVPTPLMAAAVALRIRQGKIRTSLRTAP